jgi:HD-GYP domain-containing protein (c-di-GMP phosphodiesterase class II)
LSEPAALKIIAEESGHHFDPRVVEAFFSTLDHLRAIRAAMSSEDVIPAGKPFIPDACPAMLTGQLPVG